MAYIPTRPYEYADRNLKSTQVSSLSGGVVFSQNSKELEDNQSPDMRNMWYENGHICKRWSRKNVCENINFNGKFHGMSEREFYGKRVLHIGAKLYCIGADDSVEEIFAEMPDMPSLCVEVNAQLYFLIKNECVIVDSSFNVTLSEPYVPLLYRNMDYYNENSGELYEEMNMYTRRIRVQYTAFTLEGKVKLPLMADIQCPVKVLDDSGNVRQCVPYFQNDRNLILNDNDFSTMSSEYIEVWYYVDKSVFDKEDMILGCTLATAYGGTTVGGSRVFLSGNEKYPGYYFRSQLLNPTYFKELDFDIIGSGNNKVTGFAKQYGDMIVFTEHTVSKMSYGFDATNGASFPVREINSSIGCNMPKSIQLIDNRVVFANTSGVYIIDKTDNFDELNIKPISANINGNGTDLGFLSKDDTAKKECVSIDYDRKYWLCIDGSVYVWDYGFYPYYDSGNYTSAEKKLVWYYLDGIYAKEFFSHGNSLYSVEKDSPVTVSKFLKSGSEDFESRVNTYFKSKEYDFSLPFVRKRINYISFTADMSRESSFVMSVFADGSEIYNTRINESDFESSFGTRKRVRIKLPSFWGDFFSVSFSEINKEVSFENLTFSYYINKN